MADLSDFVAANTAAEAMKKLSEAMHVIPVGTVAPGGEELATPATVAGGISPYDAARRIRKYARALAEYSHPPSLANLENAIDRRTTKADRLRILAILKAEMDNQSQRNRHYINEIKVLAQHLPTQPGLPSGEAENVLRAIQAVLKNYEKGENGCFEE